MATTELPRAQYFFLDNISWETYERLLREAGEQHIRMTYDNGDLEIMTLSFGHENAGEIIGLLISILALELDIPIRSGGSTTLKKRLKKKGLEPDKCFWIAHEKAMRDKTQWDSKTDPPPDLAVEVDVTHGSLDRMAIYAALGVPEVWQHRGKKLRVYLLGADDSYAQNSHSAIFPYLDMAKVNEFLNSASKTDETTLLRKFTRWLREKVLPRAKGANGRNGHTRKKVEQ